MQGAPLQATIQARALRIYLPDPPPSPSYTQQTPSPARTSFSLSLVSLSPVLRWPGPAQPSVSALTSPLHLLIFHQLLLPQSRWDSDHNQGQQSPSL